MQQPGVPCMTWQVCGEQVRGENYFTYKDHPICEKDFRVSGQRLDAMMQGLVMYAACVTRLSWTVSA